MDASVLDLRYKMRGVLKALNRREKVRILYHGKVKGEIIPLKRKLNLKTTDHPMFGILRDEKEHPLKIIAKMRKSRYNDL